MGLYPGTGSHGGGGGGGGWEQKSKGAGWFPPRPGPLCLPDLGLGGEGGKLWGWMEIRPSPRTLQPPTQPPPALIFIHH